MKPFAALLLVSITLLLLLFLTYTPDRKPLPSHPPYGSVFSEQNTTTTSKPKMKYILAWSRVPGSKVQILSHPSHAIIQGFIAADCPEARCYFTEDRSLKLGSKSLHFFYLAVTYRLIKIMLSIPQLFLWLKTFNKPFPHNPFQYLHRFLKTINLKREKHVSPPMALTELFLIW